MRDYQRIKQTKYILPKAVYHQIIWRIRDYYRLKEEADSLTMLSGIEITGMPKTVSPCNRDKLCDIIAKKEELLHDVYEIEYCLGLIPDEYRKGVWDNIQFHTAFPNDADRSTYGRYKSKFIYMLAERFGLI